MFIEIRCCFFYVLLLRCATYGNSKFEKLLAFQVNAAFVFITSFSVAENTQVKIPQLYKLATVSSHVTLTMKQILIISAFLTLSVCHAQTQDELVNYLKLRFPEPDTLSVGRTFYDDKYYGESNLPIEYLNETLSKSLPDFRFYKFSLLFKGCYAIELKQAILIYNKSTNDFLVQPQLYNGQLQDSFTSLVGSYKAKNKEEFNKYLLNIAALLFSTIHVTSIKEVADSNKVHTFYDRKQGSSLVFEHEKRQIKNIIFKY